jgi:hypothetical protein
MERANLPIAKAWHQHCDKYHKDICGRHTKAAIAHFKLIDCISGRLYEADAEQRYVVLSYVWGNPGTASQLPESQEKRYNNSFPRTIRDAMRVAIALDIPHLWVGRYCIDQSNASEKHVLISRMNSIYAGAEVTTIAAAGSNPHYGLPGVSRTSRKGVWTLSIRGGSFVGCRDAHAELTDYPWTTRGWT